MAYKNYDTMSESEKKELESRRNAHIAEIRQTVADKIREGLKHEVPMWKQEWMKNAMRNRPHNGRTGYEYTGAGNIITALVLQDCKEYKTGRWYSSADLYQLRDKKKKIFPYVRKGEKSVYFYAFIPYTEKQIEKKRKKKEEELGRPVKKEEIEHGRFKPYPVFNADQIEKLPPVKEKSIEHTGEMDAKKEALLDDLIQSYCEKENIEFSHTMNGGWADKAYYSITDDKIVVPPKDKFTSLNAYYSTVFHEMVHSTGAKSRFDRLNKPDNRYAQEELVAETGACMLCFRYGLEADMSFKNSLAYLKSWSQGISNDTDWLFTAFEKSTQAVNCVAKYESKELSIESQAKIKMEEKELVVNREEEISTEVSKTASVPGR